MMRRLVLIAFTGALMAALTATSVFAQQASPTVGVTLSFQVVTEGEVPQNTTFFGLYGVPNSEFSTVQLTDLDGDGVYTGAVELERGQYVVRIDQGTGTQETVYGTFPGEPSSTIRAQESMTLDEDTTISGHAVFDSQDDQRSPESPGPDEMFTGTEESEVLVGSNANDLIEGLGGGDYLNGLWGNDVVLGGQGDDLLVGEAGGDRVEGGEGDDYLVAAYGYWQAAPDAPASPDLLRGGEGNDLINATDLAGAPDTVECGAGSDLVYAGVEDFVADDCEFVYRYQGY